MNSNMIIEDFIVNIFDSLYDGIFVTDNKGVCIYVNQAYERISGLQPTYLIGKHVGKLVKDGVVSHAVSLDVLKDKKRKSINQKLNTGKELLVTGNPVFDNNGNVYMVVTNVRDTTDLNKLEQQINHYKKMEERYSLEMKINLLEKNKDHIYTKSSAMKNIYELIYRISSVDSNVLITGETGVGKEFIANMVHQTSRRKNQPFIKINCGAIPKDLLESELFGYEQGSFTGARKAGKLGLFEMADKGTILLDELGELPVELQVKLLRAVQQQEFIPIGGTKAKKVDTRIIAATNQNLMEKIKEGNFRQDLYYRLNVVSINIPPLRERTEDIFPLSQFFLDKMNKKYGFHKKMTSTLIRILETYLWPGNIRELENVIERLMVTTSDDTLDSIHIKEIILLSEEENNFIPIKLAVEALERNIIIKAMEKYNNTYKAARVLGIDQSTLVRKRQKYNI
ncbi:sigma-54-dependent Fis family transcriptional regulator [Cytobacillus oceanisediminis]|uniref:sigma-54 interaction domain-containing protein n=1 Tax=Cytobacillus oceanisediminis TaxID=665099 RepID=UPI002040D2A4|nr:sigma 54-interacting transcriptional regulator [Cytobacillus oceanisediminis]MCM3403186.1 sigma 54-interacting transcriptional regulator [Cytobacillus oceanisediminis]MDK7666262.1 sigma 54-interacting transcriptional regulator [Cytobacillus oceanisediminis]